uniref:Uncharacterized protein n=1 Tax=Anguilla anguilla TaxID=7936 RepID=A0A0E9XK36_ANGAN
MITSALLYSGMPSQCFWVLLDCIRKWLLIMCPVLHFVSLIQFYMQ